MHDLSMHNDQHSMLLLSVLVLAVGPLIYQVARIAGSMLAALDGFVFAAIGGLVLLYIVPSSMAQAGVWALLGAAAGFFLPSFIEQRLHGLARPAHLVALLLGLTGIAVHAFVDGLALLEGEGGHDHEMLPMTVVLHRLPVGLTVWLLLRPLYGFRVAAGVLASMGALTALGFFSSAAVAHLVGSRGWGVFQALVAGSLLHVLFHRTYPLTDQVKARGGGRLQAAVGALGGIALLWAIAADHGMEPALEAAGPVFVQLARESAPALLLAYVAAGLVYGLLSRASVAWMGRGGSLVQALRGMGFGLPLPICSCGVVPVYRGLVRQGVPPAAGMAFLVATPELSLDAVLISLPLLGGQFTALRVACAAVVALGVGWWVGSRIAAAPSADGPVVAPVQSAWEKLRDGVRVGLGEVVDATAPWILLGLGIAAVLEPLLHSAWLDQVPGWLEVPLFAALGIPTYVCASGATPLVAVLLAKGVSPGAALAFLLTGPATNVTTFGVLARLHGRGPALLFGATILSLAMALGYAVDGLIDNLDLPDWDQPAAAGVDFEDVCLALLTGLFGLSLLRQGPRAFVGELFSAHTDHDHDDDHDHDHEEDACCAHEPTAGGQHVH